MFFFYALLLVFGSYHIDAGDPDTNDYGLNRPAAYQDFGSGDVCPDAPSAEFDRSF
jgi:hypothetical protein